MRKKIKRVTASRVTQLIVVGAASVFVSHLFAVSETKEHQRAVQRKFNTLEKNIDKKFESQEKEINAAFEEIATSVKR